MNRHPEEWDAFHMDMLDLEDAQQKKEAGVERMRDLRSRGDKLKDGIMNLGGEVLEHVPDALKFGDKVLNYDPKIPGIKEDAKEEGRQEGIVEGASAVAGEADEATNRIPTAPATAGFGTNVSAPGSSLAMNTTMNPAAAGALYAGDTDAALAAQYGGDTQYAAAGGMMEMNPIMDNKGKYTTPQTEINDNPFVNKAKNSGIMGVL
jgi:hypothetical protein